MKQTLLSLIKKDNLFGSFCKGVYIIKYVKTKFDINIFFTFYLLRKLRNKKSLQIFLLYFIIS